MLLDYKSHQAFSRFFRQQTGMTPAQWAEKQRLVQSDTKVGSQYPGSATLDEE